MFVRWETKKETYNTNERETGTYKNNVEKKREYQTNKHNRNTNTKIRNNSNNTKQERQQENKQDNGTKKKKLKRELLVLPETVEAEEETLAGLHRLMSTDDFYQRPLAQQRDMVIRAEEVQTRINSLMERWETLEKLLD